MSYKRIEIQNMIEPTTETIELEIIQPNYSQLLEYKFILYKFPKPIKRNIQSIQVLLETEPTNFLQTKGLYISLNANLLQLTTPVKIYPNILTQILQYTYIPTQLTPEYQLQLIANIENLQLLNSDLLYKSPTPPQLELQINLKLIVKYFIYENAESIDKLTITHNNDIKTLVVKNGNIYFTKIRETYGSHY